MPETRGCGCGLNICDLIADNGCMIIIVVLLLMCCGGNKGCC